MLKISSFNMKMLIELKKLTKPTSKVSLVVKPIAFMQIS